jgi:hypothetical protein
MRPLSVHQGTYNGHAYLLSDGIKTDGSNAANVSFWFEEYGERFHMAAFLQREDDMLGHPGTEARLLSAGK